MIVTKKAEKAKLLSKEVFPNLIMSLKRQDVMSLKDFLLLPATVDYVEEHSHNTTNYYNTITAIYTRTTDVSFILSFFTYFYVSS